MIGDRSARLIALLTDLGTADGYAGVMKAIILSIAPEARLLDLTHDVPPHDVRHAAWVLHTSWSCLPPGSVCLAVVDPGAGAARRPIAFACDGRLFLGPDNGLFSYLTAACPPTAVVTLDNAQYHLPDPSTTFYARDIFAPCAAHLAAGTPLEALGSPLDPAELTTLPISRPKPHDNGFVGHVLHIDRYGNLITDFGPEIAPLLLQQPGLRLQVGGVEITARVATFGEGPPDEPFALLDSSGHLAIAMRERSAASRLSVGVGAAVLATGRE
jgi:S-adenosyl-L-methionine hydrolase (adenosine-forming)